MNKPEWTYCRNCVAWREMLDPEEKRIWGSTDEKVCRLLAHVSTVRSGDDGCCEGVPKQARGGK